MDAIQLPVNPADSTAIKDQDPPYMGCQSLPSFIPSALYTHPPPIDKMPAIFSTRIGKLPVRYIPQGPPPVVVRSDLYRDVFYTAEKYIAEHPEAVSKIEFWPTSYESLHEYFDPYDIWMQGAQFLFLVIHRLAWYTLTKKRRIERLVTTWCSKNIPKLAQLPFVGSPVKMLLDADDWHYFNFSNISEHDMNLICHKLDRAAYDIKPHVDQYKEFQAAATPASIHPVSPVKQGLDDTQAAAIVDDPSSADIGNGEAQEHTVSHEPSPQTHATLPTPFSNGNGQVAHQKTLSATPGANNHAPSHQQIQAQNQTLLTPTATANSKTNVALRAPANMGNEFSRHAWKRALSGYSVNETLAELKDDDMERIPRVALPGQLNRPPSPAPRRPSIISKLYNEKVDYNLAAAERRLLSIRLTDTYDTAAILRSDFVLKMLVTCGEIESYRPYNAHAEMSFYSPRAAKDAADKLNNKRFGADGFRLIIILVQPFNNSPLTGRTIDHNSHNNFIERRDFPPQDARAPDNAIGCPNHKNFVGRCDFSLHDTRANPGSHGRSRLNTGNLWASAPVFTPMATPQIHPLVGPNNEARFAPAIGVGSHSWRATRPPALNPYPVSRHRAPHAVMANMLGMNCTPSTPPHGTPSGQPARPLHAYPSMSLLGAPMGQVASPPKRYPSTPLTGTLLGQLATLPNGQPATPLVGTSMEQSTRQPNEQQHEQKYGRHDGQQHEQQHGHQAANGHALTGDSSRGRRDYKKRGQPHRNNPTGYQTTKRSILKDAGPLSPSNTLVQPAQPPEQDRQPEADAELFNDYIKPPPGLATGDAEALGRIIECVTAQVTKPEVGVAPRSELPKSRSITRSEEIETVAVAALASEAEVKQTSSGDIAVSPDDTKSTDAAKAKSVCLGFEPLKSKSKTTSPKSGDEHKDGTAPVVKADSSSRGRNASIGRGGKRKKRGVRGLVAAAEAVLSPTGWPSLSAGPSVLSGENGASPRPSTTRTLSGRRDSLAEIVGRPMPEQQKKSDPLKEVGPRAAAGGRVEGQVKEVEWQGRKLSMASEWEVEAPGGDKKGRKRGQSPWLEIGRAKEVERVKEW